MQLRAASPSVRPPGVLWRQRHFILDKVSHSVSVYCVSMKLFTQVRAQSGIMSQREEEPSLVESELFAEARVTDRSDKTRILWIEWKIILWRLYPCER